MLLDTALLQKAEVLPIAKVGSILLPDLIQGGKKMKKVEDTDILIQVQGLNQNQYPRVIQKSYQIIIMKIKILEAKVKAKVKAKKNLKKKKKYKLKIKKSNHNPNKNKNQNKNNNHSKKGMVKKPSKNDNCLKFGKLSKQKLKIHLLISDFENI